MLERRQPPKTQQFDLYHSMAHPDMHPISFTYLPVASVWVVTLHKPFLYSDLPLPCHPPSYWLRLFSSQTFSHINSPTFSNLVILHTYPPMKMEQTERSETSPSHPSHLPGYEDGTDSVLKHRLVILHTYPPMKMEQSVLKRRLVILHTYPPMKMEQTECSEMSPSHPSHLPAHEDGTDRVFRNVA